MAFLPFSLFLIAVLSLHNVIPVHGNLNGKDPQGFQGIPWGTSLEDNPDVKLLDSSRYIKSYSLRKSPPQFESISVESVTLFTIHDRFARVLIRYHGDTTHQSMMEFLKTRYGEIHRDRGAMVRGLNQQYTWRGDKTEINLLYRGLREQGFLFVESREFAPAFLDALTDHSH